MEENELVRVFRSMAELKRRKEYRKANWIFVQLLETLMKAPYDYPLRSVEVVYETDVERNKILVLAGYLPCRKMFVCDLVIMQWWKNGHLIGEGMPVRCLPRKLRKRVPVFIKAIRGSTIGRYIHLRRHEPRWIGNADDLMTQAMSVLKKHHSYTDRP